MTARSFLGMYDLPAQRAANDRIWAALAADLTAQGVANVPPALCRDRSPARLWRDNALLFGQACGYPLVQQALPLRVVALPAYATGHDRAGRHRSLLIARRDDPAADLVAFRGRRAAINDRTSNTGMNLFRAAIAPIAAGAPFFADVVVTGSHRDSLRAIAGGDADLAAIDSVTHAGLARFEPDLLRRLRIVAETPDSPTLPFVTARDTPADVVAALDRALARVIADPALAEARDALFLTGLIVPAADPFAELPALAQGAADAGYPVLA